MVLGNLLFVLLLNSKGIAQSEANITGTWYDAANKPWTVSAKKKAAGELLYSISEGIKAEKDKTVVNLRFLPTRPAPIKNGVFTVDHISLIQRGSEVPTTRFQVNSKTPNVLIVKKSFVYRYSKRAGFPAMRFELTRKKGILEKQVPRKIRSLTQLEKSLSSKKWIVRRGAIRELGTFSNDVRAVELLIQSLQDPFYINKLLAIRSLAKIKNPKSIEALVSCRCSIHPHLSNEAHRALVQFGPEITDRLLVYLNRDTKLSCFWEAQVKKRPTIDFHRRCYAIASVFTTWNKRSVPHLRKTILSYWDHHDSQKAMSENLVSTLFLKVLPSIDKQAATKITLDYFDKYSKELATKHRFARYDVLMGLRLLGRTRQFESIELLCRFYRVPVHPEYANEAQQSLRQYNIQAIPTLLKIWEQWDAPDAPLAVRQVLLLIRKQKIEPHIRAIVSNSKSSGAQAYLSKLNAKRKKQLQLILGTNY